MFGCKGWRPCICSFGQMVWKLQVPLPFFDSVLWQVPASPFLQQRGSDKHEQKLPRGLTTPKHRSSNRSNKSIFDPWGMWGTPLGAPFSKSDFEKCSMFPPPKNFELLLSEKHVLGGKGVVSSPWGYEHRVRDAFLHLLVVGNLRGAISNLCLITFSALRFFVADS